MKRWSSTLGADDRQEAYDAYADLAIKLAMYDKLPGQAYMFTPLEITLLIAACGTIMDEITGGKLGRALDAARSKDI